MIEVLQSRGCESAGRKLRARSITSAALLLLAVAAAFAQAPSLNEILANERDPDVLADIGMQAAQAGDSASAEKLWARALQLDSQHFAAHFNLGYMHFRSEDWDLAAQHLKTAADLNPTEFNPHYLLGNVELKRNRRVEALKAWGKALKIQPDNVKLMQVMIVEYDKGRFYEAAAALSKNAVEKSPYDLDIYLLAITAQRQASDFEAGLELAQKAHKTWDKSARVVFEHAWHLLKLGRSDEALPLLEQAIAIDAKYEEPLFFYGDWLVEQGRYDEAVEPLHKALAIRPDYFPAKARLARALMGQKLWDEARAELEETIRMEPRHPQPHLLLSQIYFRMGERAKAREERDISLKLRRENPTMLEAAQGKPFP